MARIVDLATLAKTSIDSNDFFVISNTSGASKKLNASGIFPSLVTAGTGSENLWSSITNKNQLNFKGIKSGDTGLLTVTTVSDNIVLTALEAGIDLSLCNNSTSSFLTGINFSKNRITGINLVSNGGTGLSRLAKGSILYASADNTLQATAAPTNGQLLMGNSTLGYPVLNTITAGSGVTVANGVGTITLTATHANSEANIDMRNAANNATYNIDLVGGTAFVSGDGSAEGLTVDNDGKVFIGQATPATAFADTLNIKGGIRFTNTDAPTIKPTATTSATSGQTVTIEGGGSAGAAAGHLNLTGGTASGNGAGGSVILTAGRDTSGTADGTIQLKTYTSSTATAGLTVAAETQDVAINTGNLIITASEKGIVHSGMGTVTQATNHTTEVEINSTSGKIQLAAVALAAATNVEFTVQNDSVQADSVILLSMQDENTVNNASLTLSTHTIANNSFKISIHNPAATGATSTTASFIHFLVINNSIAD